MSAESGQKWNKGSNASESGIYQYIFGKKWTNHSALSKQESGHFELRVRAGVAFRRVCKTIKIVGKVFVYERLLTNFVEKMLHKHSDWVRKKY